jgi:hypothetical protein
MEIKQLGKVKRVYLLKPFKAKIYKTLGIKKISTSKLSIYLFLMLVVVVSGSELLKIFAGEVTPYTSNVSSSYYQESLEIDKSAIVVSNRVQPSSVLGISTDNRIKSNISLVDRRAYVFDQYFLANNSPLYGYGSYFVEKCEQYGAPKDCVTIVAIARNETDLCKYSISAEMHNCWGFGGGGVYRITFNSFEESIDRVSNVLMEGYGTRYIEDPSLMEGTFCGPQDECKNWGNSIKFFIRQIEEFSKSIGMGSLLELRNS